MSIIYGETDIDELLRSVKTLAAIAGWNSNGYFEALAENGPMGLDELDGDERALKVTARILANVGLLVRRGDKYDLSAGGATCFRDGILPGPRSLKGLGDMGRIDAVLKDGGPVPDEQGRRQATEGGVIPGDAEHNRRFMDMLYRRSETSAVDSARWIASFVNPGATILDLGGGHGRYSAAFAEAGLRPTLMDIAPIVEYARDRHGDSMDYREGDFFTDDLGGPYDVVFASNIIHGFSHAENLDLFKRLAAVLSPGGSLVIKDMFLDAMDFQPRQPVYFAMTMLFYTANGDSPGLDEVHDLFRQVGLEPQAPVIQRGYQFVIGRSYTR